MNSILRSTKKVKCCLHCVYTAFSKLTSATETLMSTDEKGVARPPLSFVRAQPRKMRSLVVPPAGVTVSLGCRAFECGHVGVNGPVFEKNIQNWVDLKSLGGSIALFNELSYTILYQLLFFFICVALIQRHSVALTHIQ